MNSDDATNQLFILNHELLISVNYPPRNVLPDTFFLPYCPKNVFVMTMELSCLKYSGGNQKYQW